MTKKSKSSVDDILIDEVKELRNDVKMLIEKVSGLEVKASIWGGLMGVFGGVLTVFIPKQ